MSGCGCLQCERAPSPWKVQPNRPSPISEIIARIESPVEMAFFNAFFGGETPSLRGERLCRGNFSIAPQVKVGPFWADFVVGCVLNGRSADVFVEVDGHDFHERTPEQAEHDHRRDRAFVRLGAVVYRFTGREITRDAAACVDEVEKLLLQWLSKAAHRSGQ